MERFIHLRTQSSYSLLSSTLTIKKLAKLAKKNSMQAIALTDYNNGFGLLEFALELSKVGIKPIHGAILDLLCDNILGEVVILAKDQNGYKNLLKLISTIYLDKSYRKKLYLTFDDLIKCNEGLILLSGYTEGVLGKFLYQKQYDEVKYYINKLISIFNDRFYLEIMRHGTPIEKSIEYDYVNLAMELNLPLVATNRVLFDEINSYNIHKVLLTISKEGEKEFINEQCYFKTAEEMELLFQDIPGSILNTYYIALRCSAIAQTSSPKLPSFGENNCSEEELLKQNVASGLKKLFKDKTIPQIYLDRLNYELEVILLMKFGGYFLIVADYVGWAKRNGIRVGPGRGSGVGSLVSWCLGITDVDPIHFGLFFERFLNPDRISMPDLDIDFCQERRDEVIEYVIDKYGREKVGHIITFGSMQARAVVKDVARVLKLNFDTANYITNLIPFNAINPVTLEKAIHEVPELKYAFEGKGLYNLKFDDYDEEVEMNQLIKQILDTALALEGLQRHISVHASGVVISGENLMNIVPLYKANDSNELIIQYSMKYAELSGLVKFDFLGLQTLTIINKCCQLLKLQDIDIDVSSLPLDDGNIYQLFSKGDTNGVFQFESVGMKNALKKLKPDRFEELMALTSLYRPGPMDNIDSYVNRKYKKEEITYIHPLLKNTLKETYGIIIYQEQVMECAKILAGYSLAQADLLRRAMGKKIKEEMDEQEELFVKGTIKNGVDVDQAKEIFATIAKFAGYGFNKSHATGYSLISYQTAYLKTYYLTEFLIACLDLVINEHHKINMFLQEARDNNIPIMLPDINQAEVLFSTKIIDNKKCVIYGLSAIKNISIDVAEDIVNIRKSNGNYKSVFDFVEKLGNKVNKKVLDSLFLSGSFDSLIKNRKQLYLSSGKLLSYASLRNKEKETHQMMLIRQDSSDKILPEVEDWDSTEKSFFEFDMLGIFLTFHPLSRYELCDMYNTLTLKSLNDGVYRINIAGIIQKKNSKISERGNYIVLQLSDQYGNFDVSISNENILRKCSSLDVKSEIVLTCEINKHFSIINFSVLEISSINDFIKKDKLDEIEYNITNINQLKKAVSLLNDKAKKSIYFNIPIVGNFVAKVSCNRK